MRNRIALLSFFAAILLTADAGDAVKEGDGTAAGPPAAGGSELEENPMNEERRKLEQKLEGEGDAQPGEGEVQPGEGDEDQKENDADDDLDGVEDLTKEQLLAKNLVP